MCKKTERAWQDSELIIHKQIYIQARRKKDNDITREKQNFYKDKIKNSKDSKEVFNTVKTLTTTEKTSLPEAESDVALASQFNDFFTDKITKIRNELSPSESNISAEKTTVQTDSQFSPDLPDEARMNSFQSALEDEIEKIIPSAKSTTCKQDPFPTSLLKKVIYVLLTF